METYVDVSKEKIVWRKGGDDFRWMERGRDIGGDDGIGVDDSDQGIVEDFPGGDVRTGLERGHHQDALVWTTDDFGRRYILGW